MCVCLHACAHVVCGFGHVCIVLFLPLLWLLLQDFLQSLERQHCNDLAPLGFVFISSYPGFAAFNEALPSFVAMSEYGLHQFKVPDPPLGLLLGLAMQRAVSALSTLSDSVTCHDGY